MTKRKPKILIYGYGNPGRQDDGVGVMLSEEIERWLRDEEISCVDTDSNYQLNLEDAAEITNFETVIFADASHADIPGILFEKLHPSPSVEFTMHAVSPAFILHMCGEVFDHVPEAYLLHIKGYSWEFMQELTPEARQNLEKAIAFVKQFIGQNKLSCCQ